MAAYIGIIVSGILSVITLIYTVSRDHGGKFRDLDARMVAVETKISVFWKDVSFDMGRVLHSPHPENARMDYLIEQFQAERITTEEMDEMVTKLKTIRDNHQANGVDRLASVMMLRAMQQRDDMDVFASVLRGS